MDVRLRFSGVPLAPSASSPLGPITFQAPRRCAHEEGAAGGRWGRRWQHPWGGLSRKDQETRLSCGLCHEREERHGWRVHMCLREGGVPRDSAVHRGHRWPVAPVQGEPQALNTSVHLRVGGNQPVRHFLASGATCWRFVELHRPGTVRLSQGLNTRSRKLSPAAPEQVQTMSSGHT